jgi:hypothetical protein
MTRRRAKTDAGVTATALDRAVAREDWEAVALYVLVAFARIVRETPAGTLDDLLAVLAEDGGSDAPAR